MQGWKKSAYYFKILIYSGGCIHPLRMLRSIRVKKKKKVCFFLSLVTPFPNVSLYSPYFSFFSFSPSFSVFSCFSLNIPRIFSASHPVSPVSFASPVTHDSAASLVTSVPPVPPQHSPPSPALIKFHFNRCITFCPHFS